MSWDLLKRFIESDVFSQNPFLSVAYLSRYADHVGIPYALCTKLRQFSYEEIEFFLPQLCHLIISLDNESMALEQFILDLCEESVNAALLTFWLLQTYLRDLSPTPHSRAFKTCRRLYNEVQHIVFRQGDEPPRIERIKENALPVMLLGSFVLASAAMPLLPRWAGPLAIAQARRPQYGEVTPTSETPPQPGTPRIVRSHTTATPSSRPKKPKEPNRTSSSDALATASTNLGIGQRSLSLNRPVSSSSNRNTLGDLRRPVRLDLDGVDPRLSSSSLPLPELRTPNRISRPPTPVSAGLVQKPTDSTTKKHRHHHHHHTPHVTRALTPSSLTQTQKVKLLRQNYFRCETQFITALQDISNRLVIVPKPARLSALRAELALIAQDLPAEVDIPVICPATLLDGAPGKSRHHRIVRLNPAEATVLNSAEKVPYLLMVEVLKEDFSFDPDTPENEKLLHKLLSEEGSNRRRIFDLSESPRIPDNLKTTEVTVDSVFEPVSGDLGHSPLIQAFDDNDQVTIRNNPIQLPPPVRLSSGTTTLSTLSNLGTPRTSGASTSRSSSPGPSRKYNQSRSSDQIDFSALATHMRTAAQMLAQLESTSGKRPKSEVAAIRAKIIASMQSLEEQSFDDSVHHAPTFDMIMANANAEAERAEKAEKAGSDEDGEGTPINTAAGAARMENDQKTGGVQRKGDRDDPSAATFGEAWHLKKERIRKSSPYGWMKNWDVLSVIVKTGSDLRQEAFACQLIQVCDKIWQDAEIPVWVKRMRILVTGESSGLIETITNGVSLHSLKRSLTLATIESGKNPRGRIATLKDHFVKTFGPADSDAYKAAEDAFKRSLAAYSIISYILQLKDRHNGNVLIDNEGHIIHIDFGFMLSNSPGSVGFEAAPFKLTQEYVDVLGGPTSQAFEEYKKLCKQAFQALRRSADNLIDLVNMMGQRSNMPCFSYGVQQATNSLRQRFQLQLSADEAEQFVETDLIGKSLGSYYTRLYDTFQYRTQGIY
ncbi:phosphatidylinositol 4-kinase-like protein PIK1 [Xylogone sp. PMI_703]|nr:phosphatidylinositol 4-kinase-like protein PIK1 [Xylogone sp. PMI_703]